MLIVAINVHIQTRLCTNIPLELEGFNEWPAEKAQKQETVPQHHDKPHFREVHSAYLISLWMHGPKYPAS